MSWRLNLLCFGASSFWERLPRLFQGSLVGRPGGLRGWKGVPGVICELSVKCPAGVGAVALKSTWKLKKTLNKERPQTPGHFSQKHVRGRLWLASR